ncbi:MAG: adenylate/guanylate cyclase domain-containing protein [Actinobacteria bacterium]|nr:adenylate/guanylate cyclase domain-containing protein [Actinomycetota bacterium]
MARRVPEGTVTFLFTDIEDPTRRSEDTAAGMAVALQRHDAIVRDAIESHDGHVFAAGNDGFSAAFSTAADAAAAAVASQRSLSEAAVPFRVRMGVHTGEAIERDGSYVGPDVGRAARLMSLAHGGQVVVSDATEVLLRDRVALRPLGDHRLRGLRGRMTVYQLIAEGLRSEFPVIGSVDSIAGNLPHQLSSFVGREELVTDVAELVRSNRLVTLSGVGGVGKTRLALEVGAELAGELPEGGWLVELAPVTSPSAVVAAIATTLGITPLGRVALIDSAAEALAPRRLLLVLDNCEHVLAAAAAAAAAILERPGNVRILATSRESLGASGEALLSVGPLALDGGVSSDAATLFADRARTVRPDFGLQDPATAAAVVEICEVLDGLPLGIELAAARMAAMSAGEVRDRLADRFRLLQGPGAGPERQQTLSQAVGWSYDLLTDDEQDFLRVASVFAGGFDLESICAVVEGADPVDVLGHLDSLVRKSLVVAAHTAPRTRYSLFETIRQFAEDRLSETGALDQVRDRHASHFGQEAAARWEHWEGPGWRDAVDWVDAELGNLRAGFRWSFGRGEAEVATDIAAHAALMGFSVQLFETLAWAEELLDAATTADVRRLPRLYTAAGYACFAGRAEAARVNAHRATELETDARYDGCEPGYASFVEALGQVYCGDLDRYVELTGMVAERHGGERGYALASYVDGLQSIGRLDEALALAEESVAVAREHGNPYWIAYALWIAGLAFSKADARRALAAWDAGVAFVREHRVGFFEGFLARDAARLHTTDGEPETALVLFNDAIGAFHRAGNVPQLIITLASVPALFERLERPEPAATLSAAMAREPSSAHHVPELADLDGRLRARLGAKRAEEVARTGGGLDLNGATLYAQQQIEVARRSPSPSARPAPPGGLSRREVEVLRLVADGRTAREIAAQLFISARTAEHHIQHVYTKIGVSGRAAATRWAVRHKVVEDAVAH